MEQVKKNNVKEAVWEIQMQDGWTSCRLKELCEFRNGYTPSKQEPAFWENGTIPWYRMEDIRKSGRKLDKAIQQITEIAVKGGGLFSAGSFILATTATIGEHALLIADSLANQRFTNLKIRKSLQSVVSKDFMFYHLFVIDEFCHYASRETTFSAVNMEDLRQYKFPIPPHSEQVRIVEYLDAKCGDIDNRIAVLEKEQKAYERLKVAVINRAVTEGLDPETPKRNSGLDWLGMIPEHWEVKRLKDLGYLYSGLTGKAGDDFRCDDESLTKPYVPFTNILNNTRVSKDLLHRVVMSENEDQNKVRKGDLLFLMSSEDYESIAKSAVVSEDLGEVYLNSFCRGFRPNTPEIVSEFVNYQLYAIKYRDNLRFEARGFTRINIKIDKISSMTVTLPPYSEQKAIVEYLDTKCAAIDAKIGNIAKRIEAYKRLKRALINEVVTGKRAV